MLTQPKHSEIGASSAERWFNCPGSVALINQMPYKEPSSKYADEGTVAHMLVEKTIKAIHAGIEYERALAFIGHEINQTYQPGDREIKVTEDMVEAVTVCIEYVHSVLQKYGLQWSAVQTETRYHLAHIADDAFGTADITIHIPFEGIIVVDYKHGKGVQVNAENNKQTRYYGLGAYYALPEFERADVLYVEVVICQPRSSVSDSGISVERIAIRDLLEFEKELCEAVQRVKQRDSTLLVGSWCRFCNAKPVCPAQREHLQRVTSLAFDKVETQQISTYDPSRVSPESLAMLMENAGLVKEWADSVIAMATRAASQGVELPGYKLVTKYGNRAWSNEADVEDAFGLEFGDEIYNKKIKSPAQMEKLLKKRKAEIEPYVVVPEKGQVLAKETDTREKIETKPSEVFEKY